MRKSIPLIGALIAASLLSQTAPDGAVFLEKPYLQLGDSPKLSPSESLVLMWQTGMARADWAVEVRTAKDASWRRVETPSAQTVSAPRASL